jgi:hypothetical protein
MGLYENNCHAVEKYLNMLNILFMVVSGDISDAIINDKELYLLYSKIMKRL